jgi:GR25 family glycosyltransferase involved in LPS biosynthesis
MNFFKPLNSIRVLLYLAMLRGRLLLPRQRSSSFSSEGASNGVGIGQIYVINLDREPSRWENVRRELDRVIDRGGDTLVKRTRRFPAVDARNPSALATDKKVCETYTLAEQLFVEPQPAAAPQAFELERPIRMSRAEIAVARSHIGTWEAIAYGDEEFALVLEDDVWFARNFARDLDAAWSEMVATDRGTPNFDLLYLSYLEVKGGAHKAFLSKNVFRPERGLWYFSGYVLSRKGAAKLLKLLPCRGPIDLWINHEFRNIDVRAIRSSRIGQRVDLGSNNSYSILPSLTKIGVINSEGAALFPIAVKHEPVFAFCDANAGATSLAMALSMLGYRCCSDLDRLPMSEMNELLDGGSDRVFNAYVNIACLTPHIQTLTRRFPLAKFIFLCSEHGPASTAIADGLQLLRESDCVEVRQDGLGNWSTVCEHLKCAPPTSTYPHLPEIGHRTLLSQSNVDSATRYGRHLQCDVSPWVVDRRKRWAGFSCLPAPPTHFEGAQLIFDDSFLEVDADRWFCRDDTFPGNLGLFRSGNVSAVTEGGLKFSVQEEALGVRDFSAGAISSKRKFLFGRFEAELKASRTPGVVTGFFLHRDSPRQEIDIEIVGNKPDHLLVNVFYSPGDEGAKFDYGYRGTPTRIPLGFDASQSFHRYAIEWNPSEIRWFVDGALVHRRYEWEPTPIPHLPMTLHLNAWPSRSRELAGRLARRALPSETFVRRIAVDGRLAVRRNDEDGVEQREQIGPKTAAVLSE